MISPRWIYFAAVKTEGLISAGSRPRLIVDSCGNFVSAVFNRHKTGGDRRAAVDAAEGVGADRPDRNPVNLHIRDLIPGTGDNGK